MARRNRAGSKSGTWVRLADGTAVPYRKYLAEKKRIAGRRGTGKDVGDAAWNEYVVNYTYATETDNNGKRFRSEEAATSHGSGIVKRTTPVAASDYTKTPAYAAAERDAALLNTDIEANNQLVQDAKDAEDEYKALLDEKSKLQLLFQGKDTKSIQQSLTGHSYLRNANQAMARWRELGGGTTTKEEGGRHVANEGTPAQETASLVGQAKAKAQAAREAARGLKTKKTVDAKTVYHQTAAGKEASASVKKIQAENAKNLRRQGVRRQFEANPVAVVRKAINDANIPQMQQDEKAAAVRELEAAIHNMIDDAARHGFTPEFGVLQEIRDLIQGAYQGPK